MAPRGPKTAPRQPQEGPRRLRMAPMGAHESPRCIAMASRALPTAPRWILDEMAKTEPAMTPVTAPSWPLGGAWEVRTCPPSQCLSRERPPLLESVTRTSDSQHTIVGTSTPRGRPRERRRPQIQSRECPSPRESFTRRSTPHSPPRGLPNPHPQSRSRGRPSTGSRPREYQHPRKPIT